MSERVMVVAVKKPTEAKEMTDLYEVDDEVVMQMVNKASENRKVERNNKELACVIVDLRRREAAVRRREVIVGRREEKQRAISNVVNVVVDSLLVVFSAIGMVASVLFCLGL